MPLHLVTSNACRTMWAQHVHCMPVADRMWQQFSQGHRTTKKHLVLAAPMQAMKHVRYPHAACKKSALQMTPITIVCWAASALKPSKSFTHARSSDMCHLDLSRPLLAHIHSMYRTHSQPDHASAAVLIRHDCLSDLIPSPASGPLPQRTSVVSISNPNSAASCRSAWPSSCGTRA